MRKLALLIIAASGLGSATISHAQVDPSQTYANPDGTQTEIYRSRGPCSDPWVTIALIRARGVAERDKCDIKLYNNGSWRDYNELVQAVARRFPLPVYDFRTVKADEYAARAPDGSVVTNASVSTNDGKKIADVVDGQATVDPGFARLVAAGGGNILSHNGSTLVAAGGGNVVPTGGGSLVGNDGASGPAVAAIVNALDSANVVSSGANYSIQSARTFRALKAATVRRRRR